MLRQLAAGARFVTPIPSRRPLRRRSTNRSLLSQELEARVLLAAVVTTDLQDYYPGQTAIITSTNDAAAGTNFATGEAVRYHVTRTDGIADQPQGNVPWYVTDGVGGFDPYQATTDLDNDGINDWIRPDTDVTANASISTGWFVEEQYLGATLLLTATGQNSGAVATHEFTDSGIFSYSGSTTSATITAGASGSIANVVLTVPKFNHVQTPTFSFASTVSPTITVVNSSTPGANEVGVTYTATTDSDGGTIGTVNTGSAPSGAAKTITYTFSIYVGSSVTANTYSIKATAFASIGSIGDASGFTVAVTVPAAVGTVASVAVGSQTGTATYGALNDTVTYFVDATRGANGNFTGNYSVSRLPAGVTLVSFSPTAGSATGSTALVDTTLTLQVDNTVNAGSYNFTVTLVGQRHFRC